MARGINISFIEKLAYWVYTILLCYMLRLALRDIVLYYGSHCPEDTQTIETPKHAHKIIVGY